MKSREQLGSGQLRERARDAGSETGRNDEEDKDIQNGGKQCRFLS
jgi:hypothetical protein